MSIRQINQSIKNMSWVLTSIPNSAKIYTNDDQELPVPTHILDQVIPQTGPSLIPILFLNETPILTIQFGGGTLRNWMNRLFEGLHNIIDPENLSYKQIELLYTLIGRFGNKDTRLLLINKLETGYLKPVELIGNYKYFEGGLTLKKGIWYYHIGS